MNIIKATRLFSMSLLIGAVISQVPVLNPISVAYAVSSPASLFTTVSSSSALNEKLAAAKQAGKPAMIEFFATWCPYCKALDRDVLSDAAVQESMKPFTAIRVDISVNSQDLSNLMEKYRIYGVPAVVFYNKSGKEYKTHDFEQGITKKDLIAVLNKLSK